ncbi:MAG: hypothetical protein H7318_14735 [Oligoflexus sp.]|nr:hypothetical protein [Oligoflexus sp.]
MKRLFLTLFLLAAFTQGSSAKASGSNTVLFPVRFNDYIITQAFQDISFNNSSLYNFLESAEGNNILIARVSPYIFRSTYYYTYWGYEVDLDFAQFETVTFEYYPMLKAILGKMKDNQIMVLLPQIPRPVAIGQGVLPN